MTFKINLKNFGLTEEQEGFLFFDKYRCGRLDSTPKNQETLCVLSRVVLKNKKDSRSYDR